MAEKDRTEKNNLWRREIDNEGMGSIKYGNVTKDNIDCKCMQNRCRDGKCYLLINVFRDTRHERTERG